LSHYKHLSAVRAQAGFFGADVICCIIAEKGHLG
jgi:hypothetical protein